MPRPKTELDQKLVDTLTSYHSLTKAPDGIERLDRVLGHVLEDKIDEWLSARFADWDLADLIQLKSCLAEIKVLNDKVKKRTPGTR